MNNSVPARITVLPLAGESAPGTSVGQARDTSLAGLTDEVLIAGICSGREEALDQLFHTYAGLVHCIGRRILRDDTEAEDLVQDVFIYLYRKCAAFDGSKSSARSWIVQMTYHRAIERRRYLVTRHFYTNEILENQARRLVGKPTIEEDYSPEAVFGRNGLTKVFEALSEDQRETLRLYFFEGYTLAEISEKLMQPLGNVRNHYYRGLTKLRKQMFRSNVRSS